MDKPPQDNHMTYRPVPLSHQQLFNQQNFFSSPLLSNSMPSPQNVYSPLLVVTPMHTPMVEEELDDTCNVVPENPIYLDQGVFAFDDNPEQHSSTNQLLQCEQQEHFGQQDGYINIQQMDFNNVGSPFGEFADEQLDEDFDEFSDGFSDDDDDNDFDDNHFDNHQFDGNPLHSNNPYFQEVVEKIEQLKQAGDERNKLLNNMIENQK
ncbi:Uncharacterized protein QTN25_003378 [Entamoeba marina]